VRLGGQDQVPHVRWIEGATKNTNTPAHESEYIARNLVVD
jgi:hypothetical protein